MSIVKHLDLQLRKTILGKFRDSGFSAFSEPEVAAIEQRLARQPSDPLAHLYQGFVHWSEGRVEEGSCALLRCRDLVSNARDTLVGIEIGANSWMPDLFDRDCVEPVDGLGSLEMIRTSSQVDAPLTILMCADESYFQRFRAAILAAASNVYSDCIVHLHLLNPSDCSLALLQQVDCPALSVSVEATDEPRSHKAFYASSRFLIGRAVMDHYNTHLLTTDVDVFPSAHFESILSEVVASGVDLSCGRNFRSWMPWNTHIVTKCFFRNNACGRGILTAMSAYIRFVADRVGSYENLWWIDQNAMHFAVMQQQGPEVVFRPIASFGQMFVGPEKVGKEAFAAIASDFFDASHQFRPTADSLLPGFLSRHGKELLADEALRCSLVKQSLQLPGNRAACHWFRFLLPLHLVGALSASGLDDLLACAIRVGDFALAAACVLQGKKAKQSVLELPQGDTSSGRDQAIEAIAPVMARHKMFSALKQLSKHYGSADKATLQHFRAGDVRALLQKGLVQQAKLSLQEHFKTAILVGGIQRSGTNYLAELLRQFDHVFTTYTDDNSLVYWKHALPGETQKHRCNPKFKSPVNALEVLGMHCVILYKTPWNWLDSVVNRFPADFFDSRTGYVKHAQDFSGMINFYALFLNRWRAASLQVKGVRILLMNYERLVATPEQELSRLPGIVGKVNLDQPLDLAYSRGFAKRSVNDDAASRPSLPDEALKEIDQVLNTRLAWLNHELAL